MLNLLRLDMTSGVVKQQPLPAAYHLLGGRGLCDRLLLDEVPADCDALGPANKLVFACGLLGGTLLSSMNRISVGGKSPLTGGIKEANGGGCTALRLAQLGYRAVVVEGQPPAGKWFYIVVGEGRAELIPAGDLAGLGCFETAALLRQRHDARAAVALIGVAGERLMNVAGIAHTDQEGLPVRYSARGGLGAVMGSKGLKAMVVLPARSSCTVMSDEGHWRETARKYYSLLRGNQVTSVNMPQYGTASTMEFINGLGGLPTRNFSAGQFEKAGDIGGTKMREEILARGGDGNPSHACMPGCIVKCSNRYPDKQGRLLNSPMEYENNVFLGANLGIGDLDEIARLNYLCNDLGVDVIETGAAIGLVMETGMASFGDSAAVSGLLRQVGLGTDLGEKIGRGAVRLGKVLGVNRVAAFEGQSIGGYDPRVLKVNGVTYASSPMGGDHTAGNGIFLRTDHLNPVGKVVASRDLQIFSAWVDSLGLCTFARVIHHDDPTIFPGLVNARYGTSWVGRDLEDLGKQVLRVELEFNRRAGLQSVETAPAFLAGEPLPPHNSVFDVAETELRGIWQGI
jgi:aldehyde:ferredoxin oxidoreductase